MQKYPLVLLISTMISLIPAQAISLNLTLPYEESTALTNLTNEGWQLLKKTTKGALNNSKDGSSHSWQNKKTLNAGVITILSSTKSAKTHCRNTRFINTTGELTSTTFVNLCQQGDKWAEGSARSTTTKKSLLPNPSQSILYIKPISPANQAPNNKGNQTAVDCLELSRNIDKLKEKPLRRSAAADLFKAECQR